KGMDARAHCRLYGVPSLVNICLVGARQPCNDRRRADSAIACQAWHSAYAGGDLLHRLQITGACRGETCLHDVYAQARQLVCNIEFLVDMQGSARALLAIAQRSIKDDN